MLITSANEVLCSPVSVYLSVHRISQKLLTDLNKKYLEGYMYRLLQGRSIFSSLQNINDALHSAFQACVRLSFSLNISL